MVLFDLWLVTRGDTDRNATSSSSGLTEYLELPLRRSDKDYILDTDWDFGAPRQERHYDWTIIEKEGNPDGVYKPMITINGQFPGPLVEVNEGDTIVVDVHNLATNATAIHWHGIFQNGSTWMDGTSGVTQCPIVPGKSFQYKFTVKDQAGTYFYHGHQGVQALDGLVGPLIVHSREEAKVRPLPYVSDRVIMLHDWYYDQAEGLMRDTLSPGNEDSPIPNAALINGLNKVDCSLHTARRCDNQGAYLPTIDLAPGVSHQLRFINLGGYAWFQVSVDEHTSLPVVEIDGTSIEPAPESDIVLSPGQRYSAILTTNQADQSGQESFWLRARMIKACFAEPTIPENGSDEARAIVRYSSPPATSSTEQDSSSSAAYQVLPTTNNTNSNYPMICKDMTARARYRPSPPQPAPDVADHSWYIRVNLAIGNWRLQRGVMNSSSFRPDLKQPTLHRIIDGLAASNGSFNMEGVNTAAFDKQELVVSHRDIQTVDIILQNMDENSHPFHLHGHQFWVLGAGHGYFPGYDKLGLKADGQGLLDPSNRTVVENPLKRDVATAEGFGWVLLRFVADNPGVWLFHCHMIWHSEAGMAMQFVSRLDELKSWTLPADVRDLCEAPEEELRLGAPPKDDVFFGFHD
ncbi:multicopper oxidase-domain-containing protein [Truncatella angustata]|uniref:Multicopper oxidase-domain-containing protein n=1 Tax=Truncatella angustata TaxID=152316 RepID=A0A9P8ZUN7_9PEZI|nr:multicopper oxidase-domain-containing protein [Truncatella angustata]KAH6648383.1 multicopper oxidase-domain-containing protein [Truncatella angustata]